MRYLALLPVLALALAACSEAPVLSEPESQPKQTRPLFSTAANSSGYTAIDLGTLDGGDFSGATAINDAGQVVGVSQTASAVRAFLWDATNGMQDLGSLGAPYYSHALGINDAGQVVGRSQPHAFFWDGTMHNLGTLGDGSGCDPVTLNNAGQVVGNCGVWDQIAFLWDGTMHGLGTLGGSWSVAKDINDAGQVVGVSLTASGKDHAFLWDGTMHDLGTLGGSWSQAHAINDAGQVVGQSYPGAFLWDGTMHDLGTLGRLTGAALAINDAGQVVGWGTTASDEVHAFLWDGTMHDLGTLGGPYSKAVAINNAGQVVGVSLTASGESHAFLWDGTMHDLGTLGGSSSEPVAINDAGQVVGSSQTASWRIRATLWRILTPVEQLEACATSAADLETLGVLNKGQAHSFVNKINLATAALNDGKTTPAINKLEAFQNEASGYVNGGNLTPEQGDELISCVQAVIDSL